MSNSIQEKITVTRRDFFKISGIISAWVVTGIKSAAHAVQTVAEKFLERIQAAYAQDSAMALRKSQDNPQVQSLYANFLGEPLGELSEALLHTTYVDRSDAISTPDDTQAESTEITSIFPNPFRTSTEIDFEISEEGMVWLAVFNISGQQVRSLIEQSMTAGQHQIYWDGRDRHGRTVASGLYVARLVSGSRTVSQKMTLVR